MMNNTNENRSKISDTLMRVSSRLSKLDQQTRNYGTDVPLFEAEIHMIKSIKESEGIHVTGLAEKLGVTKGAVSQIITKLEKKGMLLKEKDENNQSKLVLKLTDKGETAYFHYDELTQKFDQLVSETLRGASYENKQFLMKFLLGMEKQAEKLSQE